MVPFPEDRQRIAVSQVETVDQDARDVKGLVVSALAVDCWWTLGDVAPRSFCNSQSHGEGRPRGGIWL